MDGFQLVAFRILGFDDGHMERCTRTMVLQRHAVTGFRGRACGFERSDSRDTSLRLGGRRLCANCDEEEKIVAWLDLDGDARVADNVLRECLGSNLSNGRIRDDVYSRSCGTFVS